MSTEISYTSEQLMELYRKCYPKQPQLSETEKHHAFLLREARKLTFLPKIEKIQTVMLYYHEFTTCEAYDAAFDHLYANL